MTLVAFPVDWLVDEDDTSPTPASLANARGVGWLALCIVYGQWRDRNGLDRRTYGAGFGVSS